METEATSTPTIDASPIKQSAPMIPSLCAALVKAQAAMGPARKTGANPHFRSTYATLADTHKAVCGPLTENGLGYIQAPTATGAKVSVTTRLIHESGEWLEVTTTASSKDDRVQAIGSVITYLRRYGLQSLTGLSAEDDDGEAAEGRAPATNWDEDRVRFCATVGELLADGRTTAGMSLGYTDVARWCELLRKPRPSSMTREQRKTITDFLATPEGRDRLVADLEKENN